MTVGALKEKLAEYPDTMRVQVEMSDSYYGTSYESIEELTEDPEVPNTIIIKI